LPSEVEGLKGRPEADNLVGIYAALGRQEGGRAEEFGGQQFSAFKPALADLAVNVLSPITDEMRRLMDDTTPHRRHPARRWRTGPGAGRKDDEGSFRHHRLPALSKCGFVAIAPVLISSRSYKFRGSTVRNVFGRRGLHGFKTTVPP
jgi:hypothetical protein